MSETSVREIHGDEMLEIMYALTSYAFHSSPPFRDKAEHHETLKGRKDATYFALYEGGTAVSCAAGAAMTQNVRGTLFGMGGVWGVATDPPVRRKGYSKRVLARLLAAFREAGRPLSCLHPFRESFYERLGYVTFPQPRTAKLSPSALWPLVGQELGGEVERTLIGDGLDTYRHYTRKMQRRVHGMALHDRADKSLAQRNNVWLAQARVGGELVGVMMYALKGERPTEFNMRVFRFYYDTSQAKYLLLEWIARHIDQINGIEITLPPFELPETWLTELEVSTETPWRTPMGRVVDVARIGGMHSGPGRFSARVTDPLCPWNDGWWRFKTAEGVLQVGEAAKAECELTIQALAALIYGTHDPGDFTIRGWGNPSPQVQEVMRGMFPPRLPYLHEFF